MEEIYTRIYVGGDEDYLKVKGKDGWSFLRCAKYGPDGHKELLGYFTQGAPKNKHYYFYRKNKHLEALNLLDLPDPNMIPWECMKAGLDFVKERWDDGDKILIACNSGRSRGPSTGLAFLRSIGDMPHHFIKAENIYRTLYPHYSPGQGIRQKMKDWWDAPLNNLEIN
jgi:hypothetical protein